MADVNRGNRPLSPHLSIYRLPSSAITSILNRATGNGLLLSALMIVWWLLAAATGPDYFAVADAVVRSLIGQIILIGSLWAVWYHLMAGLRHLYWDSGRGLEKEKSGLLSALVVIGSVVMTAVSLFLI